MNNQHHIMKHPILLTILLAFTVMACGQNNVPETETDSTPIVKPADQLQQDIGEILLVGFRGTSITDKDHIVRDIRDYHVGSVILFEYDAPTGTRHRNVLSPEQLQTLCKALQNYAGGNLLIGTDQEGGNVSRLRVRDGFPATLTAEASARGGDDTVLRNARTIACELKAAGINLNFAPCIDVNVNPSCPVIGRLGRSYSEDPAIVTQCASLYIKAHREKGILTCLKHFPGHGSAKGDTHAGLVDVTKTWKETELEPYRKLIADGYADMVMVAHVINRNLGDNLPASLSPLVVKELLRNQLGYQGVVVTDDLAMGAITRQYGFEEALRLALLAGCDLLCLSNNGDSYNPDLVPRAVQAITQFVKNGELSADDIHAAAERVRALKKKLKQP